LILKKWQQSKDINNLDFQTFCRYLKMKVLAKALSLVYKVIIENVILFICL